MQQLPTPSWIASVLQAIDAHPFATLCVLLFAALTVIGLFLVHAVRKR